MLDEINGSNNSTMVCNDMKQRKKGSSMNGRSRRGSIKQHLLLSVVAVVLLVLCALATIALSEIVSDIQDGSDSSSSLLYTRLNTNQNDKTSDGLLFPLIGLGVGNMNHDTIRDTVRIAISDTDINIRLIDTPHASNNEEIIRQGIDEAIRRMNKDGTRTTVHIITKVWYTYLGYERTKFSVQQSLDELRKSNGNNSLLDIRVHILLHWPRCRNDISWMDCNGEEEQLSDSVKQIGPPPNNETSFLDSWKALEDLYMEEENQIQQNQRQQLRRNSVGMTPSKNDDTNENNVRISISSIGVSNFDTNDLTLLLNNRARIIPHIVQNNVWTYVFDEHFVHLCQKYDIHIQVYNVMNGIIRQLDHCPHVYDTLQRIGTNLLKSVVLSDNDPEKSENKLPPAKPTTTETSATPTQVILSWLIYNNVSIIPRTNNIQQHLRFDNSPKSLARYVEAWGRHPKNAVNDSNIVLRCIQALLSGNDFSEVHAIFDNTNNNTMDYGKWRIDWDLYWYDTATNDEHYITNVKAYESFSTNTHPGHIFIARNADNDENKKRQELFSNYFYGNYTYQITVEYGDEQNFSLPSIVHAGRNERDDDAEDEEL